MPSTIFDAVNVSVAVLATGICLYAAYNAFGIRRTLGVGVYRRQALGIGLVAILLALFSIQPSITESPRSSFDIVIFQAIVIFQIMPFVLFYWVDSSTLAARRSDPLYRDTLHWSRLRFVLWSLIVVGVASVFTVLAYFQLATGAIPVPPPALLFIPVVTVAFTAFISGAIVLPIVARRSGDMTLRRHLKWFALFALVVIALLVIGLLIGSYYSRYAGGILQEISGPTGGYCLYRSAKSLLPLYRFSAERISNESIGNR